MAPHNRPQIAICRVFRFIVPLVYADNALELSWLPVDMADTAQGVSAISRDLRCARCAVDAQDLPACGKIEVCDDDLWRGNYAFKYDPFPEFCCLIARERHAA